MKRKTLKFFACAAIMAMTLSVTACGGSDKEDKGTEVSTQEENEGTDTADDTKEDDAADDANDDMAGDANDDAAGDANDDAAGDANDDTADDANDDAADDANADAAGITLEELFSDPAAKSTFDSLVSSLESNGMSVSVNATGNELIMEVKIEDSSLMADNVTESLASALDAQSSAFQTQVKALDSAVGEEGACTFTVRYVDPDGNVLTEKSFKAE